MANQSKYLVTLLHILVTIPFTEIENERLTILTKYETICLTGDFNSRISNDDCIYNSEDDENTELLSDVYKLELLNIHL